MGECQISATHIKIVPMTRLKASLAGAIVVAGLGTVLVLQQHDRANLREQNQALRQQLADLQVANESLSNRVAQAVNTPSLGSDRLRELLRLRGEVGMLRRRQRELEQAAAAAQGKGIEASRHPALEGNLPPNKPAPFQLQLVLDEAGDNSESVTNNASGETMHVLKTPLVDHTALKSAAVTKNPSDGGLQIDVEFSELGKELFAAVTKENINSRLAIVLDGQLYAAPVIRGQISDGKARITGSFSEEEASALAAKINEAIRVK
jgi:preprotein translocase subunit SecD